MALRAEIEQVTALIRGRSRSVRAAYMDRVARAQKQRPHRATLSCGNLAHVTAACPGHEKDALARGTAGNIGIVTAYNDMLSAHQPFERFPDLIKQAAREASGT